MIEIIQANITQVNLIAYDITQDDIIHVGIQINTVTLTPSLTLPSLPKLIDIILFAII